MGKIYTYRKGLDLINEKRKHYFDIKPKLKSCAYCIFAYDFGV